jgi:hypothetical protein
MPMSASGIAAIADPRRPGHGHESAIIRRSDQTSSGKGRPFDPLSVAVPPFPITGGHVVVVLSEADGTVDELADDVGVGPGPLVQLEDVGPGFVVGGPQVGVRFGAGVEPWQWFAAGAAEGLPK